MFCKLGNRGNKTCIFQQTAHTHPSPWHYATQNSFSKFPISSRVQILLALSTFKYWHVDFLGDILHHFIFVSCSAVQSSEQNMQLSMQCMSPPPTMIPWNSKQCYTMSYSINDHHRTHTVRIREVSAWSGKYIHVGARAGWLAPAQSWQWILVRLSAECKPTGSVLRAKPTDLKCVKDASRTTLHSPKLLSNQMATRRVASPIRDVAPRWYQTTCCQHISIAVFMGPPRCP